MIFKRGDRMKNINVVVQHETAAGKFYAYPLKIKTGTNLTAFCEKYNRDIVHLCETARQAVEYADLWNNAFKANGTYAF